MAQFVRLGDLVLNLDFIISIDLNPPDPVIVHLTDPLDSHSMPVGAHVDPSFPCELVLRGDLAAALLAKLFPDDKTPTPEKPEHDPW